MCRLWLPSLEPAAIGLWKIFWCQQQHLDAWHSSLNNCLDFYCGQHAAGTFYPAWVIFLFGSPWIIWNVCVSIPWGKQDSAVTSWYLCRGSVQLKYRENSLCLCVCMCFLQKKHTKIYSHPKANCTLTEHMLRLWVQKEKLLQKRLQIFKNMFVSEFANYTSRNFWHRVFFWIESRIPTGKYESKRTLLISSDGSLPPHYVGMSMQVQGLALPDSMLWQPAWKFGVFSIAAFFQCSWDVSPITHWVACVPERQELPCTKGWTGEMEEDVCPQNVKELSFVGWN